MNTIYQQLGVSLLLGLLVGLQRERTERSIAGIRTFPLITLSGTFCALLAQSFGGWVVAAGMAAVGALFVVAHIIRARHSQVEFGLTTEMAGMLMFAVGAFLVTGPMSVAVVCGGAVAVLLQWKKPLHEFVRGLAENDVAAIMQFVLITLVILPVLPNRGFGPWEVLNPFKIWLMVVLIVGISLSGYVAYKLFGARAGLLMGGVLGGLASSTATTVSYARSSRESAGQTAGMSAAVILLASAVMYARLMVVLAVVVPNHFLTLCGPLAVMLATCVLLAAWLYRPVRAGAVPVMQHSNPAELKSALVFGALFAGILLAVAAAKQYLGSRGLYAVASISGLTDVDAISLSLAQLVGNGQLSELLGWRLILVATLANFLFKAGVVATMGERHLLRLILLRFALLVLAGMLLLALWP
ncbi:MAG: MgtC/SapB family protein [Verrucomicrobiae bacterium]|nr:MgtC/SapB family protein [Verrucomicrobiae bacterium]